MSLATFKEHFDNSYQEVFDKVLVAKEIANTRFEPTLRYGESVERVVFDIDGVFVRSVTRGNASTIDSVSDSSELLSIDKEYEAVFHLSDGEITQAGPLNPGQVIGAKVAHKVAQHLDGLVFNEVLNAAYDFDAGDLTTLTSSGTAITLDGTTVPQMVSRMPAKLSRNNIDATTNMVLVVDAYAASDITQYLLGKSIDLAGSVFKNGYVGPVHNAEMYVSENLTGEVTLVVDVLSENETIVINGVTFTANATPSGAGSVDIGTDADTMGANLVAAINGGAGAGSTYIALSTANREVLTNAGITASFSAATDVLTITGRGRIIYSDTASGATTNKLHCYFGKRGAIDLVVQDNSPVDMRPTADRRGYNVFSSYLAGIKTFADGSKKFLDVHVAVA